MPVQLRRTHDSYDRNRLKEKALHETLEKALTDHEA